MLVDSGWMLDGTEEFILRASPGRPAVVMARIMADCRLRLGLEWNGQPAGQVPVSARSGAWQDILLLEIPPEKVGAVNTVRITDLSPQDCRYGSFHYWILQPAEERGGK
jgi:hypothetical protein